MSQQKIEEMNLHTKILKIANIAGVLQKNKAGFNYKYVTEEEIQAKITAGLQKYHVSLIPSVVPGSTQVIPYHYEKLKPTKITNDKGKQETINTTVPVNEIIIQADVVYKFTNADKPDEVLEVGWTYIGQMEDASQAFGAGATYGNRYFLLKAFQLATTEADPDNYRSKQKQAEHYEENAKLKELIPKIVELGTQLISEDTKNKSKVSEIVSQYNDGNPNPNAISSPEIAELIIEELKKLSKKEAK